MTQKIEFTVYGTPQQRGSKQAGLIPKRGGGFLTTATGRPIVAARDDNPKSKDWMQEVRSAAVQAIGPNWELITCPIELSIAFYFARPKSHYGSGKNASQLKPSSPLFHAQSPDLAKLIRCLEDALTGIVWRDDRQVFRYSSMQRFWTQAQEKAVVTITTASGSV